MLTHQNQFPPDTPLKVNVPATLPPLNLNVVATIVQAVIKWFIASISILVPDADVWLFAFNAFTVASWNKAMVRFCEPELDASTSI